MWLARALGLMVSMGAEPWGRSTHTVGLRMKALSPVKRWKASMAVEDWVITGCRNSVATGLLHLFG